MKLIVWHLWQYKKGALLALESDPSLSLQIHFIQKLFFISLAVTAPVDSKIDLRALIFP